jgi:hypothetical protein
MKPFLKTGSFALKKQSFAGFRLAHRVMLTCLLSFLAVPIFV